MSSILNLGLEGYSKEIYLKSIINTLFDYAVIVDKEYNIIHFYRKPYFIHGAVMKEGRSIYDYIDKVDQDNFTRDYNKALQGMEVERERKIRTVNNNVSYIIVRYIPIKLSSGEIGGVCIVYRDETLTIISENQRSRNAQAFKKKLDEKRTELKELKEEYENLQLETETLYNNITDIIFTMELSYNLDESKLIKANHNFFKEMGYLENEISNLVFREVVKLNKNSLSEQDFMDKIIKEGHINFDAHTITKDSRLLAFEFQGHTIKLKDKHLLTLVGRGLSSGIAHEEKVGEKFGMDPISGVLNRREGFRLINKYMETSIENNDVISIIYLDIIDMRKINYKFGYIIGDRVIGKFAEVIANKINKDIVFFRVDGDEFILYVKNKSKDEIYSLIADIKKEFEKINNTDKFKFDIDFRYGLAVFDGCVAIDLDKLVYIAEMDMLKKRDR